MAIQELTIDRKKYVLIPAKEYASLREDLADVKLVARRKHEKGMEANTFFKTLEKKRKPSKLK
jgi:PHD/YefM family antitoxin component YafN of YafNO toxin-antitoxin module